MKKVLSLLIAVLSIFQLQAQSLYFPPNSGNTWNTLSPQSLNWCQNKIDSLFAYLDSNNTKSFILLKDGKIVIEKYFDTHTATSPWQWASAGKTITSFMVGIAQQENYLSISDSSSKYLGQGWTNTTPTQEGKISILNQLNMTSGLDETVADPTCFSSNCLIYEADAGSRWAYHNGPYTILDSLIKNATNTTLNAYTTQKLKNPIGMSGGFFQVGNNNVFFSNTRSMARFGLLILNNGNWNGNQIMTDTTYFNQMINTSQNLNQAYGYFWWLNGKSSYMTPGLQTVFNGSLNPNAPTDMVAAMGKDGQFLNVVPSQNIVWARMGNAPDNLLVPFFMNDIIWQHLNDLECNTTSNHQTISDEAFVQIFPNPSANFLNIKSSQIITKIEIFNFQGQTVQIDDVQNTEHLISIANLPKGIYFVRTSLIDGKLYTEKVIKE